jgi:hypothetical protein
VSVTTFSSAFRQLFLAKTRDGTTRSGRRQLWVIEVAAAYAAFAFSLWSLTSQACSERRARLWVLSPESLIQLRELTPEAHRHDSKPSLVVHSSHSSSTRARYARSKTTFDLDPVKRFQSPARPAAA